jgi:hypothetical protein
MTKLLTLLAAIGLLAAPAFAAEEMKAPAAEKTAKIDCTSTKLTAAEKSECTKEAKKEKEVIKEAAPASGETKTEKKN